MKQWFVYALKSLKDGHLYIGISQDPEERLLSHNRGVTKSTRQRRPFELIFREICHSRQEAREKEIYYKSGIGRETIKKLNSPIAQSAERVAVNH
jgi:putative endonuclease